ncbi:hypothetical protein J7K74_03825 [Candidatus Woesearchaeota archaeon]|nr:hypothetical protein [Candidatus Woesearchaeota archaeon]
MNVEELVDKVLDYCKELRKQLYHPENSYPEEFIKGFEAALEEITLFMLNLVYPPVGEEE